MRVGVTWCYVGLYVGGDCWQTSHKRLAVIKKETAGGSGLHLSWRRRALWRRWWPHVPLRLWLWQPPQRVCSRLALLSRMPLPWPLPSHLQQPQQPRLLPSAWCQLHEASLHQPWRCPLPEQPSPPPVLQWQPSAPPPGQPSSLPVLQRPPCGPPLAERPRKFTIVTVRPDRGSFL